MSCILFLLSFAFYLSGLSGTVPSYRDSGDLIASVHTLGIAHPPGYALYILVCKLFVTLLPWGNAAYRVNVFSAFCAAGTATMLFKLLCDLSEGTNRHSGESRNPELWTPAFAGVTTILFASSPAVVALAHVAEMYTMASLLAAAILFCLLKGTPGYFSLAALLLGLGLSVHLTLIFLVPLFFIGHRLNTLKPILYFLLGLTVFLYLPIRASQHPLINWGDPSNWRNFWRVVTRADYGGLKLHPEQSSFSWTASSAASQLSYFVKSLKGEWGWGALVLGGLGLWTGLSKPGTRRLTACLLGSWILSGPAFFLLSNLPLHEPTTPAILQPYLLLASLLWAPFVVYGFCALTSQRLPALVLPIAAAGILMISHSSGWASERNDFYTYDYARNLLRSLPTGAVLYDPDDPTHFSIQVLQTIEGRRRDVVLLNFFRTRWGYEQIKRQWPDLLPPVPIESGQELERFLWEYSARRRPFFAELPQKFGPHPYYAEGLVYKVAPLPAPSPSRGEGTGGGGAESRTRAEALLQIYVRRGDYLTVHHPDFFTRHLVGYYAAAECNLGLEYANAKQWDKAVGHYQGALAIDPELSAAYNDWGIVAFERQDFPKAFELFQKGLQFDPANQSLSDNSRLALQKMPKHL